MRAGHTGLDEPFDRLGASSSKGPDTVGQTPNEGGRRHVTRGALAAGRSNRETLLTGGNGTAGPVRVFRKSDTVAIF